MTTKRSWTTYPATYRAKELKSIAGWISSGESGSVVGLLGSGRSNLLGFLCQRPEVLRTYLSNQAKPIVVIPIDLNNLPANTLSALYRVILRSFYRMRSQFEQSLQQAATALYLETRAERDPFLSQSALQELLLLFQAQQIQVVLVLNRFGQFGQRASIPMVNTLRGLRDDFKDTLCYIAGMAQEVAYLPDPDTLGDMYELLDNYVCWVGAMVEDDARNLIARAVYAAPVSPSEADMSAMLALSGGYPALLRSVCHWWLSVADKPAYPEWVTNLLAERSIQHRLVEIWEGLTQEEQFVLSELQKLQPAATGGAAKNNEGPDAESNNSNKTYDDFCKQNHDTLSRLAVKGVCRQTRAGWRIMADLLAAYVAQVKGRGRGRIWLDEESDEIYQGQTLLKNLTALERSVLSFLIKHPRVRHTKTDLIINTWAKDLRQRGVTDNSLYQVILSLRKEIEPVPGKQFYLITWRGKPEGGYQFFPEGRPG
ncbi:MAG TPA: response regulator transcription factor [Anaerolineae bacterium]|nr:response regulator transcription factor [Anaerolineae bacterium]